jgi:hypothetical protein
MVEKVVGAAEDIRRRERRTAPSMTAAASVGVDVVAPPAVGAINRDGSATRQVIDQGIAVRGAGHVDRSTDRSPVRRWAVTSRACRTS